MSGLLDFGLPDQRDRNQAATDFERNLVVIAGAGTGKTSLLVERVLTAIGSDRASIDRIAAITFTEKAAGEMRQRLAESLERLRAVATGPTGRDDSHEADRAFATLTGPCGVEPGVVASRALDALQSLDRARVETIHTFCAGLLREHPVEAGVDPGFEVDAGEVFAAVLEETWEKFLGRELGRGAARGELWERVLDGRSVENTRETAFALAGFGIPESLLQKAGAEATAEAFVGDHVSKFIELLEGILSRQERLAGRVTTDFQAMVTALNMLVNDGVEAFQRFDEQQGGLTERIYKKSGFKKKAVYGGVTGEELTQAATQFCRLGRRLLQVDEPGIRDLVEAVQPFALEAREELLRRGYVTFDGLLVLARDLLMRSIEVRNSLKRRFRMLLIDEFQDTDPVQYEIVLFLAEREDGAAEDAYAATLAAGKLFIVGDPKQSIYRFRGADYAAFARAVRRVIDTGGRELRLTANFRSVPEIVGPVNELFGPPRSVSWHPSPYQPDYAPIESTRGRASEPRVEVWTVDIGTKALAKERREAEGKIVAETVRRMVEDERTVGYGDITVLLRAFTHLSDYLRPLREADIPFVVDGGREFLSRPEVGHLLVVLKTLARPADPVAVVAFLRSPVGAVPDAQLAAYAAEDGRWRWSADVNAGRFPDIAHAFGMLRDLAARTRQAPADEIVRRVLDETNLLTVSAAAFEGPQRVANLEKLGAAAAELARDGRLSLIEVIEALEQGRTSTAESDSPLADEEIDAVNVMTIHKSKGLENNLVIIPDLAREDFWMPPKGPVLVARPADGTLALAVKAGNSCNLGWVRVEWESSLHEEAEETRVLYVGMTRARERLIVLAAPSRRKSSWVESLRAWGYVIKDDKTVETAELLGGQVAHVKRKEPTIDSTKIDAVAEGASGAVAAYDEAIGRLADAGKPLRAPSDEEEWRDPGDEERGPRGLRRAVSKDRARAVGVVLHRLLENMNGEDDDSLRSEVGRITREVAGAAGLDPVLVESETRELLDGFLGSALGRRLAEVEVLGRETPLVLTTDDGRRYHGTIDLIYRDADGEIVVADYKTDLESDETVLSERYRGQLAIYAEAVRRALDLDRPPKTELWHLRTTTRVPL